MVQHIRRASQKVWLTGEDMILGGLSGMCQEVPNKSCREHSGGKSRAKNHGFCKRRVCDFHPAILQPRPFAIICNEILRTAMRKMARSNATGATARSFAPKNAPASTPSETGAARVGSRNPFFK
jgi:hypothetical protein